MQPRGMRWRRRRTRRPPCGGMRAPGRTRRPPRRRGRRAVWRRTAPRPSRHLPEEPGHDEGERNRQAYEVPVQVSRLGAAGCMPDAGDCRDEGLVHVPGGVEQRGRSRGGPASRCEIGDVRILHPGLMREEPRPSHGEERPRRRGEDEHGVEEMRRVPRVVRVPLGEQSEQEGGHEPDHDAQGGGGRLCHAHGRRRVPSLDLPGPKEHEVADLEEGEERAERGGLQEDAEGEEVVGGVDHHALRNVPVEAGDPADCERRHPERGGGNRHLPPEPPEPVHRLAAGRVDHGADCHEEEGLVQDVVEHVRHAAVDARGRPEAHARDHVTDLAHDVVREELAHVVLDQGEGHAVERHHATHEGDRLDPGLRAREEVHGGLRRVHAEEDARGDVGARVGVREPRVERDEPDVHPRAQRDQDGGPPAGDGADREVSRFKEVCSDPAREESAAEHVEEEVAEARRDRVRAALPDEERRGDRHQLPEQEERHEVAREHRPDARTRVEEGVEVQPGAGECRGVECGQQRDQGEDVAHEEGKAVDPQEDEVGLHEADAPTRSFPQEERHGGPNGRERDEADLTRASPQEEKEGRAKEVDEEWRDEDAHGNNPLARLRAISKGPNGSAVHTPRTSAPSAVASTGPYTGRVPSPRPPGAPKKKARTTIGKKYATLSTEEIARTRTGSHWPASHAPTDRYHLLTNGAIGGRLAMATAAIAKATIVPGILRPIPSSSLIRVFPVSRAMLPATKNMDSLANPCAAMWKAAPRRPAGDRRAAPSTMYESWLIVEYARRSLRLSWVSARKEPSRIVATARVRRTDWSPT